MAFKLVLSFAFVAFSLAHPQTQNFGAPDQSQNFGNPDQNQHFGAPDQSQNFGNPDQSQHLGSQDQNPQVGGRNDIQSQSQNPDSPAKYNFSYAVIDDQSGNNYNQQESRDGDNTQGAYSVLLPDGRTQKVSYSVNGDSGLVAVVTYEGEAKPVQNPESRSGSQTLPSHNPSQHSQQLAQFHPHESNSQQQNVQQQNSISGQQPFQQQQSRFQHQTSSQQNNQQQQQQQSNF